MCKWEARERDRDADNLSRLIYFSVSFWQLSRQQQLKRGENVDKIKEKAEKKYNWKKWRCRCSAEMNVFLYSHRFVHTLHSYYCTSGPDSGKTPFIVYGFFSVFYLDVENSGKLFDVTKIFHFKTPEITESQYCAFIFTKDYSPPATAL